MGLDKVDRELKEQNEKKERASKNAAVKQNNLKSLKINLDESNPKNWQMNYEVETNLTKTLFSAIL